MKKYVVTILQFTGDYDNRINAVIVPSTVAFYDDYEKAFEYATYKSEKNAVVTVLSPKDENIIKMFQDKNDSSHIVPSGWYRVNITSGEIKYTAFSTIAYCNIL